MGSHFLKTHALIINKKRKSITKLLNGKWLEEEKK
jgi:hypothetical protein